MKIKSMTLLITLLLMNYACQSTRSQYPNHWWAKISDQQVPGWEILPDRGEKGKSVILSKRHELGLLSNFAATPFIFRGKQYQSMEGLWQSMKYPENKQDERARFKGVTWPYSRAQVEHMVAFEAKKAGDIASANMKKMNINWVTFEGKRMPYRVPDKGEHYQIIRTAMEQKLKQNVNVKNALVSTKNLILLPDHKSGPNLPPAWDYCQIWMELRSEL